jgi:RNA polymerase sigma-70 factor (ECF subfamily)
MNLLAEGNKFALGELVRRHQARIIKLAYRILMNWESAEDIGQETFLRVWRSAKKYKPTAQFTTWLHRIAVNICLDELKKRRAQIHDFTDMPATKTDNPEALLESKDLALAVQNAVAQLPERQRLAVVLHRFSGLSIREISQSTDWSESAVESLLVRAYAKLREKLKNLS